MEISTKKTKAIIVNFTDNYQFTSRMQLNNVKIDIVDEMKILVTIVTKDLSWNKNKKYLV